MRMGWLQGGFYEGEWSKGEREGLGVRLMRSGKIQVSALAKDFRTPFQNLTVQRDFKMLSAIIQAVATVPDLQHHPLFAVQSCQKHWTLLLLLLHRTITSHHIKKLRHGILQILVCRQADGKQES